MARQTSPASRSSAVLRRFPLLALLATAALLAGCSRSMDRADLVLINGAEPEVIDPALITAQATSRIAYALFEGLTSFDASGKPVPGVASHWEISADGRHYTFHLRPEACWSNGEPVTSRDFVYAWRRVLLPETASEYSSQLYYLRNAKEFNDGKLKDFDQVGVHAPDDHTLEVTLENPTAYFLDLCAFSTLLPVHRATAETHADWASKPEHFLGNGPFLFKEWRPFDRVRLVKNPKYWNAGIVGMESIDVLPSAKPNTAFNFYATGLADLMMDKGLAPTSLMTELKVRPDFHAGQFLGNYFIRYNTLRKPFADVRVRLALSMAIDKKLITDKITRAGEIPAFSLTPPGAGQNYQPPEGLRYDPEAARRLLAEAGYPGGKGFPIFYYLYKADSDLDRDIAVEIQGMYARDLGLNMQLQGQEWTAYLDSQSRLDYDLCRSSWVADYNDPNTFLNMFVTDDGNNRTGWSDKKYDGLIADAAKEANVQKRNAIFQQAERMLISEQAPVCPLYYYVGIQFYDGSRLGGIEQNLIDEHPLKLIHWIKRK